MPITADMATGWQNAETKAKDQQQRADRLATQLRALGIDPDTFN